MTRGITETQASEMVRLCKRYGEGLYERRHMERSETLTLSPSGFPLWLLDDEAHEAVRAACLASVDRALAQIEARAAEMGVDLSETRGEVEEVQRLTEKPADA